PMVFLDMPLSILQYPQAGPLKLAFEGTGVISLSADAQFILHRVATDPGADGSPVFNADWDLIGLHQFGKEESLWRRIWQSLWAKSEVGNGAIAVAAIVDDLRRQNVNLLDLQNMQPFATTPSSTVVSQQLRDYSPLTQVAVQPSEPPALDAYRKAAAVLVS